VSADDISAAAKTSVPSSNAAKELILSEKVSTLLYLQGKSDLITQVLVETRESLRIEELDIIRSIDGVSDITGSILLTEMGDFSNHNRHL
jgi:hypothetical protein